MIDQILYLMKEWDFDRCVWDTRYDQLNFFDRKDHDLFTVNEFDGPTRHLWESIRIILIDKKVPSFTLKLTLDKNDPYEGIWDAN